MSLSLSQSRTFFILFSPSSCWGGQERASCWVPGSQPKLIHQHMHMYICMCLKICFVNNQKRFSFLMNIRLKFTVLDKKNKYDFFGCSLFEASKCPPFSTRVHSCCINKVTEDIKKRIHSHEYCSTVFYLFFFFI